MTKEAEAHAEDDRKKKEEIEVRNHADTITYTAEKALKDAEGKISDDIKKEVEEKIQAVKDAKEGPVEELKTKADSLGESLQKIGEAMYKDQQAAGGQPSGESEGTVNEGETAKEEEPKAESKKEEAVEGEVVEEESKDK